MNRAKLNLTQSSLATLVLLASLPTLLDCTKKGTSPSQSPADTPRSSGQSAGLSDQTQAPSSSRSSENSDLAKSAETPTQGNASQTSARTENSPAHTHQPSSSQAQQDAISTPEVTRPASKPHCFIATYNHKKSEGHDSEEDCMQHRNLFKLGQSAASQNAICVKVNDRPVAFKLNKSKNEISIAPIAGPNSTVTVEYCTQAPSCLSECKVPKDEFLAALGVNDNESDASANFGEDSQGQNKRLNQEVKRELAEISAAQNNNGFGSDGISNFDGWLVKSESPKKCE